MTKRMSEVLFASAKVDKLAAEYTLPMKLRKLLAMLIDDELEGKRIAVKMHLGGNVGYSTIHPVFVREVIQRLKSRGALPFVTDGSFSMAGAVARGYTEEVLGAPVYPASGIANMYSYSVRLNYKTLKTADLSGNIIDSDGMVVLSHGKGHGNSGFAGAIKNIAMGCVARDSRGKIHRLMSGKLTVDPAVCKKCFLCVKNCPTGAIRYDRKGKRIVIFDHDCRYCMHCEEVCAQKAINVDYSGFRSFQHGMALVVRAVLRKMAGKPFYCISILTNITPLCDCWGLTTPSLVPDVGILASRDIVAVEQASIDMIDYRNYIPGSLPGQMKMGDKGHLFERIHGKDPCIQVEELAKLGVGSRKYVIREIKKG